MEKKFCTTCNMELTPDNRVRWTIGKGKRSGYRAKCHDCYINYLRKIRSTFKKRCLNYKGCECTECGYSKNIKSLEFHHKNPKEKDVSLSNLVYEKWEIVKTELDKCVVLCVNCHREEHDKEYNSGIDKDNQ